MHLKTPALLHSSALFLNNTSKDMSDFKSYGYSLVPRQTSSIYNKYTASRVKEQECDGNTNSSVLFNIKSR